jgi:hypothetical protein
MDSIERHEQDRSVHAVARLLWPDDWMREPDLTGDPCSRASVAYSGLRGHPTRIYTDRLAHAICDGVLVYIAQASGEIDGR